MPDDRAPLAWRRCPVCRSCRSHTDGPNAGRCIHGGPFTGYRPVGSHPEAKP